MKAGKKKPVGGNVRQENGDTMPAPQWHTRHEPAQMDPVELRSELEFWREAYSDHPAFSPNRSFAEYEPALKIGIQAFLGGHAPTFEEIRDGLGEAYGAVPLPDRLEWDEASSAAAAAWHRMVNMRRMHRAAAKAASRPVVPVGSLLAR